MFRGFTLAVYGCIPGRCESWGKQLVSVAGIINIRTGLTDVPRRFLQWIDHRSFGLLCGASYEVIAIWSEFWWWIGGLGFWENLIEGFVEDRWYYYITANVIILFCYVGIRKKKGDLHFQNIWIHARIVDKMIEFVFLATIEWTADIVTRAVLL